ncbi:hypothetical protein OC845_002854 [Tilletia horrida]|nr:hypothetical protein OC845_002854 [Tilletia horrida]
MPSTPPFLPEPLAKRKPPSTMWLSMAPETDPDSGPIQDQVAPAHLHSSAPSNNSDQLKVKRSKRAAGNGAGSSSSKFVGVGEAYMFNPYNRRSRNGSSSSTTAGSPSLNLSWGGSIAALRMSSMPVAPTLGAHGQQTAAEDESDEEPCCTPDHALAEDAMVLLASSSLSSSSAVRDTSVSMPVDHHHSVSTAPVRLVKTPASVTTNERRTDYFQSIPEDHAVSIHSGLASAATATTATTNTSSTRASPPDFDFRTTFAPIAFNKNHSNQPPAPKVNGGGGIEFAGRQWSGKTAHAVEQEMEALGDRVIMSFAPDAAYLASRLEGLRRNLEASNWERRPTWVGWEEEEGQDAEEENTEDANKDAQVDGPSTDALATGQAKSADETTSNVTIREHVKSPKSQIDLALPPAPATSLIEAEAYRRANLPVVSNMEGYTMSAAQRSRLAQEWIPLNPETDEADSQDGMSNIEILPVEDVGPFTPPPLDAATKAAVLNARLDTRLIKRDDLVQVRELHCYHGDGNKSPGRETYTMSAGFLLRLLVDEKHVAVVAVKRPIPAPESPLPSDLAMSIHSRLSINTTNPSPATERHAPLVPSALARQQSAYSIDRPDSPTSSMEAEDDDDDNDDDDDADEGPRSATTTSPLSPSFFSTTANDFRPGSLTGFTAATSYTESETTRGLTSPEAVSNSQDTAIAREAELEQNLPAHGMTLPASVLPQSDSTFYERDADKPLLAGPLPVAPPLPVRTLGAAPPSHRLRTVDAISAILEGSEVVVGVATAQLTTTEPLANELWPGIDPDDTAQRGYAVEEAHVLTLSVAPDERSQGLGARLLERLLEECKIRIGHNSLRKPESISVSGRARSMRAIVEVHPSNERALELYQKANFTRVPGPQGTKKNFYRGDERIPLTYRLKVGGTDAWVMERTFDLPEKPRQDAR